MIVFSTGAYSAQFHLPDELVAPVTNALRDLIVDDGPHVTSNVVLTRVGDGYRIEADGRLWSEGTYAAYIPDALTRMLLLADLDATPEALHLHGGLVAKDGKGVFIAGLSGAGKSTLTTALVRSGYSYVTDERIAIFSGEDAVTGFNKPISLVEGSWAVFPELDPATTGHGVTTKTEWQVPASSLGAGTLSSAEIDLVVFVDWSSDVSLAITDVSPAESTARLVSDSPDAARHRSATVDLAGPVVARARSIELRYSTFDDALEAIDACLAEPRVSADFVSHLPSVLVQHDGRAANVVGSSVPALAVGVRVWFFGEIAVAHVYVNADEPPQHLELDAVIDPADTRSVVLSAFRSARTHS